MRKFKLILLFSLSIIVGFIREFTFVNINLRDFQLTSEPEETLRSNFIAFLDPLSVMQLYWLKWILTVFFAIIFLLIGINILKVWFNKPSAKPLIVVYLALFIVSIVAYLSLWAFGNPRSGYIIARFFMGLAQSPFPVIFIIPALYLKR